MATVEFENTNEFLAELSKDSQHVDRNIVRVAQRRWASAMSPALLVSVVGTARVGADIYRVECICGALCGIPEADQQVTEQINQQLQSLRDGCVDLGLDVRPGALEDGSS